jgi:endogenous inhibitor of DNA gyrase (YacG/DUF329 family)
MSESNPRTVNCPTCGKSVAWIETSKYRPFCSERCQLIDFGEWATEKKSIPGEPVYSPEDDQENDLQ